MSFAKHDWCKCNSRRIKKKSDEIDSSEVLPIVSDESRILNIIEKVKVREAPAQELPAIKIPKSNPKAPQHSDIKDESTESNQLSHPPELSEQVSNEIPTNGIDEQDEGEIYIEQDFSEVDITNATISDTDEYDEDFFESTIIELSQKYASENDSYLSTIITNFSAKLEGSILTISIPSGLNNEKVSQEKLFIKQFFSTKLSNRDFEMVFEETNSTVQSDIPYTNEDKIKKMVEEHPDFKEWITQLDLRY